MDRVRRNFDCGQLASEGPVNIPLYGMICHNPNKDKIENCQKSDSVDNMCQGATENSQNVVEKPSITMCQNLVQSMNCDQELPMDLSVTKREVLAE